LFAIDGTATEDERSFAMKSIGRSMLKAYEAIIDARHQGDHLPVTNATLDSDEAIEAEAMRLCHN